jgi:hypothetical protein
VTAQRNTTRPFRDYDAQQILDAGRKAFRRQDGATLLAAIAELDEFRKTREAMRVRDELHELLGQLTPESERRCAEIQYCRECSGSFQGADYYYCGSCDPKLWARIERDIRVLRSMAAEGVYVGRSAFPERRLLEHLEKKGLDRLSVLHWAGSLEEAESFERRIHGEVKDLTNQEPPRAEGQFARCHHAIYLSWTAKSAFPANQLVHHALITELMGARQWPAPPSRFETVHLWCPVQRDQARWILDALKKTEQEFLEARRALR